MMRKFSLAVSVVCLSDTHNTRPLNVPEADLLLHAGNLTFGGTFAETQAQLDWLNNLPHRHKVAIAGKHDLLLDSAFAARSPKHNTNGEEEGTSRADLNWGDIIYLENSSVDLIFSNGRVLNIYGSPLTCKFENWAFKYPAT